MTVSRKFALIVIGMVLLLWGCGGPRLMMPTPNVHLNGEQDSFHNLNEDLKQTEVKLFYNKVVQLHPIKILITKPSVLFIRFIHTKISNLK